MKAIIQDLFRKEIRVQFGATNKNSFIDIRMNGDIIRCINRRIVRLDKIIEQRNYVLNRMNMLCKKLYVNDRINRVKIRSITGKAVDLYTPPTKTLKDLYPGFESDYMEMAVKRADNAFRKITYESKNKQLVDMSPSIKWQNIENKIKQVIYWLGITDITPKKAYWVNEIYQGAKAGKLEIPSGGVPTWELEWNKS